MGKVFEALEIGVSKLKKLYENSAKKMSKNDILGFDLTFIYLDKVLTELQAIKEANPSEAMKCLEKVKNYEVESHIKEGWNIILYEEMQEELDTIKQALLNAQEQEKVLEIIKNKRVDVYCLLQCSNVDEYNDECFVKEDLLTEEEFDLLKRCTNDR